MKKNQFPELLVAFPPIDIIITMGCNAACPTLTCKYRKDWGLENPIGKSDDEYKSFLEQIEK